MRAEIISIGTELLLGSILDTDARFLCERLAENAIDVYHHSTVGDNVPRIVEALRTAAARSDILVTVGGLGPTEDDVTMQAVSAFLGEDLVFHAPTHRGILRWLKKRGLAVRAPLIRRQCLVPRGSVVIENKNGTAPGTVREVRRQGRKVWLVTLPGPPRELEPMFTERTLPILIREARVPREHFIRRSVRIAGLIEAQVAQKVSDLLKMKPPATVGIYARPGQVELKIMCKAKSLAQASQMAARLEKIIRRRLGRKVYGTDEETLASAVGKFLKKHAKTLAVAESCTGGHLSNLVTDVPGSSDYYLGGLVGYQNKLKVSELGIETRALKKYGAVSAPVARQMAQGIRKRFGADYGIGITGIAGPSGGSSKKPVGLVYVAAAGPGRIKGRRYFFEGTRKEIKSRAADEALNFLRLELLKITPRG